MMLVYHGLVTSKLRYGLICWATANQSLLQKINVAHNTIITYLTFSKRCTRMWPLYCKLKVLPLEILIKIEFAKTMYKFHHKMLPPVFNSYFSKPSHRYATRFSENNLAVLRIDSARDESRLKYSGPLVWNNVPSPIKESLSLKVFIKMYRNHSV